MLLTVECSESALPEEGTDEEGGVGLQVSPQVALTHSVVRDTDATADGAAMGSITVYTSDATTNNTTSDCGLYACSDDSWSNSDTGRIYPLAEETNIYTYYLACEPEIGGALAATDTASKVNGSG